MNAARAYRQTQQETASPQQLTALLFEAALSHIRLGISALKEGKPTQASQPLTKASTIVLHLRATLKPEFAPKLCGDLSALYQFVAWRLTRAALGGRLDLAQEAERVFAPIAGAFTEAIRQMQGRP